MSKFLSAVVLALASGISWNAHADVVVCNKSGTHAMSVAMAHQYGAILTTPYSVFGWKHIPPNRCEFLAKGDVVGASVWVLAVSKGIILTRGAREKFSAIKDSDQRFCISDSDFEYDRRDVGATRSCPAGQYLATFPITVWNTKGVGDLTIEMNPDEFVKGNAGGAQQGGPKLPDLHGALARGSDGTYYASYLQSSSAEARRSVMAYCASQTQSEASCQPDLPFKSQCVAVVSGRSQKVYHAFGQADWSKAQTAAQAMSMCRQAEGDACAERIAVCSTYGELSAQSRARDAQAKKEILGALGKTLGALWNGAPPPSVTAPPGTRRGGGSSAESGEPPIVQICTPMLVDSKGRFFPAAKTAIDNGDMGRHFDAVNKNIDAMKADPQSALHSGQPAHLQLIFGSFQSADKAPRVQAFPLRPEPGKGLQCPPLHRQENYPLAAWMHKPGISPRDVPRAP